MWNFEPEFLPLLFTPLNEDFLILSFQVTCVNLARLAQALS